MSKVAWRKPTTPRSGRMENGSFKPDNWQGRCDAERQIRRMKLQGDPITDTVPLCLESRSRDYWIGFRQAWQDHAGIKPTSKVSMNALHTKQFRQLVEAVSREFPNVQEYLDSGGQLDHLLEMFRPQVV